MLAGCGGSPPLAPVEGVVRVNGQPLHGAEIEFQPEEGLPSMATTDAQGRYKLRYSRDRFGAVSGKHTVRIRAGIVEDAQGNALPTIKIPAEYNERSTVQREVVPGSNMFDFDLKVAE